MSFVELAFSFVNVTPFCAQTCLVALKDVLLLLFASNVKVPSFSVNPVSGVPESPLDEEIFTEISNDTVFVLSLIKVPVIVTVSLPSASALIFPLLTLTN